MKTLEINCLKTKSLPRQCVIKCDTSLAASNSDYFSLKHCQTNVSQRLYKRLLQKPK